MKQRTAILLLSLVLMLSMPAHPVFSAAAPEGWEALRDDLHMNVKTITRLDDTIVSAWIYLFPQKGSDTFHAAVRQLRTIQDNSSDLEYIGYLTEIHCGTNRYKKLTTIYFREDRNIIAAQHRRNPAWRKIEDNSMYQDLYQSVCGKDTAATAPVNNRKQPAFQELNSAQEAPQVLPHLAGPFDLSFFSSSLRWHFLYFRPLPHQQSSFLPGSFD